MRVLRRLALVASFVVGAASGATAQSVRFRVTDDIDEAPVPTALVTLLTDRAMWRADESGILMVRVRHAGPNVFTIRRIGYEPVTTTLDVPEHDMLKVHVVMHHAAQHLDTVSVSAPAMQEQISAFDRRRMNSIGGRFITLADIERKRPIETLDLFTNQLGLRVVRPPNGASRRCASARNRATIAPRLIAMPDPNPPRLLEYTLPGGWTVLAGRTDADNDRLSIKVAAANDYWFHVRGMPGSHVVLRCDREEEPDRATLEAAAAIAAYHSKARNGGIVPVSCTLAKYVTKPRGAKPGTVEIRKETTLKVRPRLP
jgi:hypothetical protein